MRIDKHCPINKTAALVVSKGFDYVPDKKPSPGDSPYPLETRPIDKTMRRMVDLSGLRFGFFTVIGLSVKNGRWVVRCDCGRYAIRHTKSINNPANDEDCCDICKHSAYLKRHSEYLTRGRND